MATNAERRVHVAANHLLTPEPTAATAHAAFEYTVDNSVLTLDQRNFYEENGYLLVRGLIKQHELEQYRNRFIQLCNKEVKDVSPLLTFMRDLSIAKNVSKSAAKGEALIAKIQDFEEDLVLFSYCQHPDIVKYVKAFCGPDVKSVHTMFINKPPGSVSGGTHPLHQDLHYFPFRPSNRIVAAWTAVDRCTMDNGCLQVIPGTHKGELLEHGYPQYQVNAAYHEIRGIGITVADYVGWHSIHTPPCGNTDKFSHLPRINAVMEPGDTIFFNAVIVHGSGPNNTQGYRKAISGHFASSHCNYIDVTGTTQETMAKEFDQLRKKLQPDIEISYDDFWKFKARLVAGVEDTL